MLHSTVLFWPGVLRQPGDILRDPEVKFYFVTRLQLKNEF